MNIETMKRKVDDGQSWFSTLELLLQAGTCFVVETIKSQNKGVSFKELFTKMTKRGKAFSVLDC